MLSHELNFMCRIYPGEAQITLRIHLFKIERLYVIIIIGSYEYRMSMWLSRVQIYELPFFDIQFM